MLLVAAHAEALGSLLLVIRVSFMMAVPAGRSVVFVTGNAKKLEEVRVQYFIPEMDCVVGVKVSVYLTVFFLAACCAC